MSYNLLIPIEINDRLKNDTITIDDLSDNDKLKFFDFFNKKRSVNNFMSFLNKNSKLLNNILTYINFNLLIELNSIDFMSNHWTQELINLVSYHSYRRMLIHCLNRTPNTEIINLTDYFSKQHNFIINTFMKRFNSFTNDFDIIDFNKFYIGYEILHNFTNNKKFSSKNNVVIGTLYYKSQSLSVKKKSDKVSIFANKKNDTYIKHDNNNIIRLTGRYDNYEHILLEHPNEIIFDFENKQFYTGFCGFSHINNEPTPSNFINKLKSKNNNPGITSQLAKKKLPNLVNFQNYNMKRCYCCMNYIDITLYGYKSMCTSCGIFNFNKKLCKADMNGFIVYISGVRSKIGFAAALKLLNCGAYVIGSSRWSHVALMNFTKQDNYTNFKDRLELITADFTNMLHINKLIELLKEKKINTIINNACRTIEESNEYLNKLINMEQILYMTDDVQDNDKSVITRTETGLVIKQSHIKPITKEQYKLIIKKTQMIELRDDYFKFYDINEPSRETSWTKSIDQLHNSEIMKVTLINQVVPTLLINSLLPYMAEPKFVINVTAIEGQFDSQKNNKHAHTNMCKAAVNMLSRTLAEDKKIHSYTIDPGYVSGVMPKFNNYPIDMYDGGARVVDPLIQYYNKTPYPADWIKIRNYTKGQW